MIDIEIFSGGVVGSLFTAWQVHRFRTPFKSYVCINDDRKYLTIGLARRRGFHWPIYAEHLAPTTQHALKRNDLYLHVLKVPIGDDEKLVEATTKAKELATEFKNPKPDPVEQFAKNAERLLKT